MALTLAELCAGTEKDYGMTLIAGEKGIDNMVQWVHYIEGGEVPRFLHGYELVFTTGMENHNTGWLIKFAEKLHEYRACGFVINLGPYVKDVPSEVIDYCNRVSLPLYTIPWETRIIDITYELCHHIVTDEKQSRNVADTFIYAINNPLREEKYKPELEKIGFVDGEPYEVAALKIDMDKEKLESAERVAKYNAIRRLNKYTQRHSVFSLESVIIIICQGIEQSIFEKEIKELAESLKELCDGKIAAGTAVSETNGSKIYKAYRCACDVVKISLTKGEIFNKYSDMGVYKILMAADDKECLKNYCDEFLGALRDYDEKNNTDYLNTLRLYLENDSSITAVASITFVHRNTVNYKIKKIKEILGCELTQSDKLKIMLAFAAERLI